LGVQPSRFLPLKSFFSLIFCENVEIEKNNMPKERRTAFIKFEFFRVELFAPKFMQKGQF
jgi:hypothetical protein